MLPQIRHPLFNPNLMAAQILKVTQESLHKRLKKGGVVVLGELKTYIRQQNLFFYRPLDFWRNS